MATDAQGEMPNPQPAAPAPVVANDGVQLIGLAQMPDSNDAATPVISVGSRQGSPLRRNQYLAGKAAVASGDSNPIGMMKIDFVLTYEKAQSEEEISTHESHREELVSRLTEEGVVIETACERGEEADPESELSSSTRYLLLHASFPLLARFAEAIRLQMPLRDQSLAGDASTDVDDSTTACSRWSFWDPFRNPGDNAGDKNDLFTAPFQKDRMEMFMVNGGTVDGNASMDSFFTSAHRSLLLHSALVCQPEFTRCIASGAIKEAYPLHDGSHVPPKLTEACVAGCENDRQELQLLWVAARNWWRFQPLMLVRRYFGEKVAMYFAWLGAYNMWLLPISLLGVAAFIFGLITVGTDETVDQICDDAKVGGLLMCPVCDGACGYWRLRESCTYSCIVHVFDNKASVIFAGIVSLWATCFLEFWKRRQCTLQYRWDVTTCEQDEVPRPEFKRTKLPARSSRYCFSLVTVLFMMALVIAVLVGVITYRVAMLVVFSSITSLGPLMSHLRLLTTGTAACINFVFILLLNQLYKRVAMQLTKLERPRTEIDFEDSYTVKMYCFQFVNYYSSLFYIAFVKGALTGRPGEYSRYPMLGGVRLEECDPAGCQVELVVQMLIVFVAKQLLNTGTELGPPLLRKLLGRRQVTPGAPTTACSTESDSPAAGSDPWVKDRALTPVTHLQLFDEYLEMVMQFGFVVLFVAAMPLAPLFALLNNAIELRLDAWKMVALMRRPVAHRARDIGAWLSILATISALSVVTNSVIVGFTSEQIPKMVYQLTNGNGSLAGYIQWRLSLFRTADFEPQSVPSAASVTGAARVNASECRYRDFRYPPNHQQQYQYTTSFWHVLAARMAFVLVFEHLVLVLKNLVDLVVPDRPSIVKEEMKRERELLRKALFAYKT